jgi:hypothetical protein
VHGYPAETHHTIDEWWDEALEAPLQSLSKTLKPNLVIVNYGFLSKAFEYFPSSLKVLDTHDVLSDRDRLIAGMGQPLEFFWTTPQQEAIALDRADIAWAITDVEAQHFRRISIGAVEVVPHWEPRRAMTRTSGRVIGLIGADNAANRASFLRFLQAVDDIYASAEVAFQVVIAGNICASLREWVDKPWLELSGQIEDITSFYADVDVVAVPMLPSSGQKIKGVEALSYGHRVVSTRWGIQGCEVSDPGLLAASPEDVARQSIDALDAPVGAFDVVATRLLRQLEDKFVSGLSRTLNSVKKSSGATLWVDWDIVRANGFLMDQLELLCANFNSAAALTVFVIGDARLEGMGVDRLKKVAAEVSPLPPPEERAQPTLIVGNAAFEAASSVGLDAGLHLASSLRAGQAPRPSVLAWSGSWRGGSQDVTLPPTAPGVRKHAWGSRSTILIVGEVNHRVTRLTQRLVPDGWLSVSITDAEAFEWWALGSVPLQMGGNDPEIVIASLDSPQPTVALVEQLEARGAITLQPASSVSTLGEEFVTTLWRLGHSATFRDLRRAETADARRQAGNGGAGLHRLWALAHKGSMRGL